MMSKGSRAVIVELKDGLSDECLETRDRMFAFQHFPKALFFTQIMQFPNQHTFFQMGTVPTLSSAPHVTFLHMHSFMNHVLTFTFTIFHLTFFKYFHPTNMDSALIFTYIFIIRSELCSVKKSLVN